MSDRKLTIEDMIYENRNREYGSYLLRKRSHIPVLIGLISSIVFFLIVSLGYFWYLTKAGDEKVYHYSASNSPFLRSAYGNLLSPEELSDLIGSPPPPSEKKADVPQLKKANPIQSFRITENPVEEEIKPLEDLVSNKESEADMGLMINDSTAFGGFVGDGMGAGGTFDRIPEFPGGDATKYVERTLRYPPLAIKQKIHGTVIVSFVISKTGHVTDVKVERGVNPIIDEEAVKTIRNMPPWKPGMRHGKPINFLFRMPINFMPLG